MCVEFVSWRVCVCVLSPKAAVCVCGLCVCDVRLPLVAGHLPFSKPTGTAARTGFSRACMLCYVCRVRLPFAVCCVRLPCADTAALCAVCAVPHVPCSCAPHHVCMFVRVLQDPRWALHLD